MQAIIEQWEVGSSCPTDNTEKYVLLMLFKLGLDAAAFYLCCGKLYASILSMGSLSIVMADLVMTFFLAAVWFLGADRSPVPLCFLLANASATYGALPLPMVFMGLLDYYLHITYLSNHSAFCKYLKSTALILLGWMLALIYSLSFIKAEPIELDHITWIKAVVCEVDESRLIFYFILVLFTAVTCAVLPFFSNIPRWLKEAERLSEDRYEKKNQRSDLFITTNYTQSKLSEECLEETIAPRPPLWLSLTLGFGLCWMPYLTVSVACLFFGFGTPAYITVNVLWLECTNSLLMGVVFWAKSNMQGPYRHLPENVCLWHVYWYLSKGTRQQQLPIAVLHPPKMQKPFSCVTQDMRK